jgi:hypothetical protein
MLQTLHHMLDTGRVVPAYGMNLGTVGFLMNRYKSSRPLEERIARARIAVSPLKTKAITNAGTEHEFCAINEVSLLRETRQTAKLEVTVNGKVRMQELACDGVLVATPAGSTAYNLSANGPSCRSARTCWRLPRSARSGPAAGAARSCPTTPGFRSACSIREAPGGRGGRPEGTARRGPRGGAPGPNTS